MKRWSHDYDECQGCHSTDRPHLGKGFCTPCYYKQYERKTPAKRKTAAERESATYVEGHADGVQDAVYAVNAMLGEYGTCWLHNSTIYLKMGELSLKGKAP